jgi:hypothetical protein
MLACLALRRLQSAMQHHQHLNKEEVNEKKKRTRCIYIFYYTL